LAPYVPETIFADIALNQRREVLNVQARTDITVAADRCHPDSGPAEKVVFPDHAFHLCSEKMRTPVSHFHRAGLVISLLPDKVQETVKL
jgi:hypothetical protein